jgi:hypothetical protein
LQLHNRNEIAFLFAQGNHALLSPECLAIAGLLLEDKKIALLNSGVFLCGDSFIINVYVKAFH